MAASLPRTRHSTAVAVAVLAMACGCTSDGLGNGSSALKASSTRSQPPCPLPLPQGETDSVTWAPFVVVDDQMFTPGGGSDGRVDPGLVGDAVATVTCRLANTTVDPNISPRDGDASLLPAGTTLHAIDGRPPTEALTIYQEGAWRLFEPQGQK